MTSGQIAERGAQGATSPGSIVGTRGPLRSPLTFLAKPGLKATILRARDDIKPDHSTRCAPGRSKGRIVMTWGRRPGAAAVTRQLPICRRNARPGVNRVPSASGTGGFPAAGPTRATWIASSCRSSSFDHAQPWRGRTPVLPGTGIFDIRRLSQTMVWLELLAQQDDPQLAGPLAAVNSGTLILRSNGGCGPRRSTTQTGSTSQNAPRCS